MTCESGERYLGRVEARRPNLTKYAGRFVALDFVTDEVLADAATLPELASIIQDQGLKASIVRAPREDEPVLVGVG